MKNPGMEIPSTASVVSELSIRPCGLSAAKMPIGTPSTTASSIAAVVNSLMGPLAHANVDWTFGPLRYVIVSPVYHRWHHVKDPAVYNRNFAPTFPIWDLMFGTCYMPKGVLPSSYGVEGVPPHFLAQMIWPFQEIARRFTSKADAAASA